MAKGRPPGPSHPMPMDEFWVVVLEQLPEVELMHLAYDRAELIVEIRFGRRRFGSYESFRVAKFKFYRVKTKPVI